MTATLLEKRREKLAKYLTVFNGLDGSGGDLKVIADYPRYEVSIVASADEAEKHVKQALAERNRVLWVVNTVDRAQHIARRFADDAGERRLRAADGIPVFCYHSRFKLMDRKSWHNRVVKAFRSGRSGRPPRAVLAVTTQVCEMSLDLDADVLVTEYAPASSLVQRMGRCCRDTDAHQKDPPRVGQVVLYPAENSAPYTKQDMLGMAVRTVLSRNWRTTVWSRRASWRICWRTSRRPLSSQRMPVH